MARQAGAEGDGNQVSGNQVNQVSDSRRVSDTEAWQSDARPFTVSDTLRESDTWP